MMRENWRGRVLVAAIGVLALSCVGCSWRVGRFFGETWFICGSINATDTHTRHQVTEATGLALEDMGFPVQTQEFEPDSAMLEGVKGRNTIRVHLSDREGGGTAISYHIDSFGKWYATPRRLARTLLEKTRARLGESSAPATVQPPKK